MFWWYMVFVLSHLFHTGTTQSVVRVRTKMGDLEGIVFAEKNGGKTVNQFLKIPYAMPPVGDLRFKKPVPVKTWKGVYNATMYGPSCMQIRPNIVEKFLPNKALSEDCLYLNIYVPNHVQLAANKSIMIWIHGGGFQTGEAEMFDGSNLSLTGDVIVVTINYRLGVFGFLSTGDQISPGNYGLWDQLMAIKWVKENILEFGGNPNSITLFGQSAGAYSISLLSMAPQSDGLFQRVIGESGSSLGPSGNNSVVYKATASVAKALNCPFQDSVSHETIRCLRNASAQTLLNTSLQLFGSYFAVVFGDELVPDYPGRLLSNKTSRYYSLFSSRDILYGVNSAEFGLNIPPVEMNPNVNLSVGIASDVFCKTIVPFITNQLFSGNDRITNAACEFYKASRDLITQARNSANIFDDVYFVAPMVKLLNLHSISPKGTYQYLFSLEKLSFMTGSFPKWFSGATHGDELSFVFGMLNFNPVTVTGDQAVADLMMTYWTNFAKFGDPNGVKTAGYGVPNWPSYSLNKSYMNFSHNSTAEDHLFQKRMDFWLTIVPYLASKNYDLSNSVFG